MIMSTIFQTKIYIHSLLIVALIPVIFNFNMVDGGSKPGKHRMPSPPKIMQVPIHHAPVLVADIQRLPGPTRIQITQVTQQSGPVHSVPLPTKVHITEPNQSPVHTPVTVPTPSLGSPRVEIAESHHPVPETPSGVTIMKPLSENNKPNVMSNTVSTTPSEINIVDPQLEINQPSVIPPTPPTTSSTNVEIAELHPPIPEQLAEVNTIEPQSEVNKLNVIPSSVPTLSSSDSTRVEIIKPHLHVPESQSEVNIIEPQPKTNKPNIILDSVPIIPPSSDSTSTEIAELHASVGPEPPPEVNILGLQPETNKTNVIAEQPAESNVQVQIQNQKENSLESIETISDEDEMFNDSGSSSQPKAQENESTENDSQEVENDFYNCYTNNIAGVANQYVRALRYGVSDACIGTGVTLNNKIRAIYRASIDEIRKPVTFSSTQSPQTVHAWIVTCTLQPTPLERYFILKKNFYIALSDKFTKVYIMDKLLVGGYKVIGKQLFK